MLFQKFITLSLIIVMLFTVSARGDEKSEWVKNLVSSYLEEVFDAPAADIQLRFIHIPDSDVFARENYRFVIESKQLVPRLGFQTLWLLAFKDQYLVERLPITIDVSIYLDVIVAAKKLRRGEIITPEKIEKRRLKISRDYQVLIRYPELAIGLLTRQVIREGVVLRKSMLREAPDIRKGDEVRIQLVSGDLEIMLSGEVKRDGMIGEKVQVICETTGKQVYAVVQSPQLVVMKLR